MKTPAAIDSAFLNGWLSVLDEVSYYELFGIEASATPDDVRHAFHRFAYSFHPDQHRERSPDELRAIDRIFKRGNEAFLVLSEPFLRAQYDRQLANDSTARRMTNLPSQRPPSQEPQRLEDKVRAPSARPFARRAEELVAQGDFRQAKLQMVLARHMDAGNDELEAYLKFIESNLHRNRPEDAR